MNQTMHHRATDVLVVGGGVAGVMAAIEAHHRGLTVAVVERRPYLGREITAYNHTWVADTASDDDWRACPAVVRNLFQFQERDGTRAVPEGYARQELLALLESRGIPVLFEAEAIGASTTGQAITGALLACPPGVAWVAADVVLDCTEQHQFTRVVAGQPFLESGEVRVHACLELTLPRGVAQPDWTAVSPAAEDELGLEPGSLRAHPTLRDDTLAIEFTCRAGTDGERALARSLLEIAGRRKMLEVYAWLRTNLPDLAEAQLTHQGFECCLAPAAATVARPPLDGLVAVPELRWGFSLADVVACARAIAELLPTPHASSTAMLDRLNGELLLGGQRLPLAGLALAQIEDEGLPLDLLRVEDAGALPVTRVFTSDVCVAGVGAGGGLAMLACAERGLSVTAIEVNRDLGGTHTVGLVTGHYHGYTGGASQTMGELTKATMAALTGRGSGGGIGLAATLLAKAQEHQVCLLTGSRVCGAVVTGGRLRRVLAANEDGLFAVDLQVAIDTTGEADLAALAGAAYELGDPRDGMVQTYSMWGKELYPTSRHLTNRYLTDPGIYHPDVYSERLRAIHLAHRGNSPFHISPMLTPRESRRIVGEAAVTLEHIFRDTCPDDVIAVARTLADSHAYTSSEIARIGSIGSGRDTSVRIPFGAFLPQGLDNVLVAAKAISGERDATSFCRMNADIKNAGYAVGLAAAIAVREGVALRQLPLPRLQDELRALGILPDWAFARLQEARAEDVVAGLCSRGSRELESVLRLETPVARPLLEAAWSRLDSGPATPGVDDPRALLALALAWHGSPHGAGVLAELLARALDEERDLTPPRRAVHRMGVVNRIHGADDYSLVNRLLLCAAHSPDARMVELLARAAGRSPGPGAKFPLCMPYDQLRGDIVAEPFYARLMVLATAVERRACPALAPAMEALLSRDGVTGHDVPLGSRETPRYMLAHLELSLARAAHLCGASRGREILERYANDTHVFFRRHARELLRESSVNPSA